MNDLVSVIIPTHKGYEHLARAVDSCLEQTYQNTEVLVVDDNGKGTEAQLKTQAIMNKYADNEKVKYLVHEKNINGSAARNTGIRASKGNYISFLDDDDEFLPENLEKHMEVLSKTTGEYGLSYCGKRLIVPGIKEQVIIPPCEGDVLFEFLCGKVRIGSSFIVVKREVVELINGFDESFRRHQDWEFIARILDTYKIAKVNNIGINKYNIGRNQANKPEKFMENRLYYLNKIAYIINKFDEKKQKSIYDSHYFQIAKEYLRAGKMRQYCKWLGKTSMPVKYCFKTFSDAFTSILKHIM